MSTPLLTRDLSGVEEEAMLIRNYQRYRFSGSYWKLDYNPFKEAGNRTNKIYSSGEAGVFKE